MKSKLAGFIVIALAIMAGCKKGDVISGTHQRKVNIVLNGDYVSAQKIDSAFLITQVGGVKEKTKLTLTDNRLEGMFSSFSQVPAKVALQLYTARTFNDQKLQFEKEVQFSTALNEVITVAAPVSVSDLSWKPRIILDFEETHARLTAVVALRTTDAYFEILHLPSTWTKRITVYRGFYKNDYGTKVYGKTWDSNASATGNQSNTQFFNTLAAEVDHLNWNKVGIEVAFYMSANEITELSFTYDK